MLPSDLGRPVKRSAAPLTLGAALLVIGLVVAASAQQQLLQEQLVSGGWRSPSAAGVVIGLIVAVLGLILALAGIRRQAQNVDRTTRRLVELEILLRSRLEAERMADLSNVPESTSQAIVTPRTRT